MTQPATIRKSDLKRYAEVANETKVWCHWCLMALSSQPMNNDFLRFQAFIVFN